MYGFVRSQQAARTAPFSSVPFGPGAAHGVRQIMDQWTSTGSYTAQVDNLLESLNSMSVDDDMGSAILTV
jgi:hypothetical protein